MGILGTDDPLRFFYLIVYEYLKTLIIMSKHRILFRDADYNDETIGYNPQIETFINNQNCITIRIEDEDNLNSFEVISLDKSTAIKFAKTLRTEINKIKEDVNND